MWLSGQRLSIKSYQVELNKYENSIFSSSSSLIQATFKNSKLDSSYFFLAVLQDCCLGSVDPSCLNWLFLSQLAEQTLDFRAFLLVRTAVFFWNRRARFSSVITFIFLMHSGSLETGGSQWKETNIAASPWSILLPQVSKSKLSNDLCTHRALASLCHISHQITSGSKEALVKQMNIRLNDSANFS